MCQTKVCRACEAEKEITDFHKKGEYPDGRYPRCKICVKNKLYIPPEISSLLTSKKTCSLCCVEKLISEFNKRNNRLDGLTSRCKKCINSCPKNRSTDYIRNYDLNKSYGIGIEEYNIMLDAQNSCCKICDRHLTEVNDKHKKNLCVDHCHTTGKIRGLLCDRCNRGLGFFHDNIDLLEKVVNYLKED